MAFRARLLKRTLEAQGKDGFQSRRERTRQQRIARYRK